MTAINQTSKTGFACFSGIALTLLSFCGCGGNEAAPPASIKAAPADATTEDKPVETRSQPEATNNSDFVAGTATGAGAPAVKNMPQFKSFYTPEELGRQSTETFVTLKTSLGDIKIRLNRQKAPLTVSNFLNNYVQTGFYEKSIFHFVEKDFMVVAGGFDQEFKPLKTRPPVMNESANGLKNRRGTVGMIRDAAFDKSATSQFYVNLQDNKSLDYVSPDQAGYCVFGEVVEGMEIVDKIAAVSVKDREGFPSSPAEPVTILSCRVSGE